MNAENKSRLLRPFIAAGGLVVFTVIATTMIVAWGPALPDAVAANVDPNQSSPFLPYMVLHESWHRTLASSDVSAAYRCAK